MATPPSADHGPSGPGSTEAEDSPSHAVDMSGVHVRYGATRALAGLDLVVPAHRITALLGPNGAGKSTTVAAIAGLVNPDSGRIQVLGGAPGSFPNRCALGVMLQEGGIPTGAHAVSIVQHHAALRGVPHTADEVVAELGLHSIGRTTYRRMSGGQKRMVALACALVGEPQMVIVDEPTAGLDPQARRMTWQLLDRLRNRGVTVLLSTHDLDEAERLGDHIAIIDAGRMIVQGDRNNLLGDRGEGSGSPDEDAIVFEGPLHLDLSSLREALPRGTRAVEVAPGRYHVNGRLHAGESAIITAWATQHGIPAHRIRSQGSTLEDLYFSVIGDSRPTTFPPDAGRTP